MLSKPSAPPSAYRCEACLNRLPAGDTLTGLADRSIFRDRLATVLAEGAPDGRDGTETGAKAGGGSAVLLIDLDRFKVVNDTMGHATGDALLVAVAGRIRASLRKGDLAARLGGDEFAVLMSPVAGRDEVAAVAGRLVELLSRPYLLHGRVASVGASIGAAVAPLGDAGGGDMLLRQADMAMYQAKAEGRSRYCFFQSEMQERADRRAALEMDLRKALTLGQFELFYQPQLDLETRRLIGFEALIRWRHPVRGLVPPDGFIPVLEQMGLIAEVGEWVIREACREAVGWPAGLTVAVNVAAAQFDNGRLVPTVASALEETGLAGSCLELEIVETVLLRHDVVVMEQLHALKALEARISLDDFGTGYSSLTQLRSFPFDRIKIDRSFADDAAVVRAVAALGASLGMRTTAEGVETREQLERLHGDGCTEAQGYLLSRPVPRSEIGGIIAALSAQQQAGRQRGQFRGSAMGGGSMTSQDGLFRLVYVSRNRLALDAEAQEEEVDRILRASRRNNGALGVTGALLFSDDCFAQTLEGPMGAVEALFERIQCDDRHGGSVVLEAGPVAAREFGSWSMAYAGRRRSDQLRFDQLTGVPGAVGQGVVLGLLRQAVLRAAPRLGVLG